MGDLIQMLVQAFPLMDAEVSCYGVLLGRQSRVHHMARGPEQFGWSSWTRCSHCHPSPHFAYFLLGWNTPQK